MTERPVECSHCKQEPCVIYKEISDKQIFCTELCAQCPFLEQKLHGRTHSSPNPSTPEQKTSPDLCCATCMTTLEAVKTATPLGCGDCYEVFEELLLEFQLQQQKQEKRPSQGHIGKSPQKPLTISSVAQLPSLNEALQEALKKEQYEKAAWLRDQIKELMENQSD